MLRVKKSITADPLFFFPQKLDFSKRRKGCFCSKLASYLLKSKTIKNCVIS